MKTETLLNAKTLAEQLAHPYSRYGLAVALFASKLDDDVTEAELRQALRYAIEIGLNNFRMRTADDPQHSQQLQFYAVRAEDLYADANLVQSPGLAPIRGIYLYPNVVTTDGGAKDTFKSAVALLEALRGDKPFFSSYELSRSFAPTTAKLNNGTASQTPPKGTLLEAASTLVTTLTPLKPAAWPGQDAGNTVIIPDLPLAELRQFLQVFQAMTVSDVAGNLMQASLPARAVVAEAASAKRKKTKEAAPPKYKRPRLHNGNYPFAPYNAETFGPVGLLGAIGRWARRAEHRVSAVQTLRSLAEVPLYVVSYDHISQVRFNHHVTHLALEHELSGIIAALHRETVLYGEMDVRQRYDNRAYQLFDVMAARFLQLFTRPAFADFLAFRAEYAAEIQPLFNEYFMNIDPEIVQAAGRLGRWLNTSAYYVADADVDKAAPNRADVVKKVKAKLLVEFESAVMDAKSAPDLLRRVSERAGRLFQEDTPNAAKRFMDATASGELDFKDAQHLLVAYMRLRGPRKKPDAAGQSEEATPVFDANNIGK